MNNLLSKTSRFSLASPTSGNPIGLRMLFRSSANLESVRQQFESKRNISSASSLGQWKNESPSGGLTELYVYHPESQTIWPDSSLGVFSQVDPRFRLPGNVGPISDTENTSKSQKGQKSGVSDILTRPSTRENQAQVLHSATDYIQFNPESEEYLCTGMLESFPQLQGSADFSCELHEAPKLLRKDLSRMFYPNLNEQSGNISIITMSQRTDNDMSCWSDAMEEERDQMTQDFFISAKEICARLKAEGYWADFIDPSSGTPYYAPHTNMTLFETDEKYRLLGFRIEDLGCCKVICHREFGRNVFVGTIFTNAPNGSGVVKDIFEELKMVLGKTTGSK